MQADPELYDYLPYASRPRLTWPEGRTCAVWVAPNLEYYEIDPPASPHRKAWARPHPDVAGYSHRDHANRVGHWRMADAMTKHGFRGSVSLSVALCRHHPEVVADANARGWEFFSHGIYNTRYAYGMSEAQERAIIEDSIRTVREATGQTIRGWLAPALTHTTRTLDLLAQYGFDYTCDLYHDDQPTEVRVKSGRLTAIPYSLEVNDHYGFFVYNMSPRAYAETLIRQFDRLAAEGERSGTVMCIPLHAYLIGQPHRIGPFERVLEHIAGDGRAWIATAGEIVDAYRAQVDPPRDREVDRVKRGGEVAEAATPLHQASPGPPPRSGEELAAAYLEYPQRRRGYDHDLYDWSALKDRPPVRWPGDASVAVPIVVSVEWFPMTPSDTPFRAPGHMQTPYPDYRHYTARDYGNRVGVWRLLEAFASGGVEASFAANAAVAERYPALIEAIAAGGHEIIAHSVDMNGTIASGLDIETERALIEASFAMPAAVGMRPKGWLSIARSESWNTLDLVKAAGGEYVCDWVNDELPYRFRNGLINLPLNHELSDRQIMNVQQQSADSYAEQVLDAFQWLRREAAGGGGRMLPLHVTPYIIGLPYRIGAFEALLASLAAEGAWFASAGRVVETWAEQR